MGNEVLSLHVEYAIVYRQTVVPLYGSEAVENLRLHTHTH